MYANHIQKIKKIYIKYRIKIVVFMYNWLNKEVPLEFTYLQTYMLIKNYNFLWKKKHQRKSAIYDYQPKWFFFFKQPYIYNMYNKMEIRIIFSNVIATLSEKTLNKFLIRNSTNM